MVIVGVAPARSLVLIPLPQLRHEHQLGQSQLLQLALALRDDWRVGLHVAGGDGAQARVVGGQQLGHLGEFARIAR